jgi:nucleotide-binding universal stress UspA family protein
VFQSILCPTNFSPSADRALGLAIAWAQHQRARLELLHVLDENDEEGHLQRVARRMRDRVARARERVPSAEGRQVRGLPAREIIARAAQLPDVLVVMGTERRGAIAREVLESHAPVLLVPNRLRRSLAVPRVLVVPTDARPKTVGRVTRAMALAAELHGSVELVEGIDVPDDMGWESALTADVRGALASAAAERHQDERDRLHVPGHVHVAEGPPAEMIAGVADDVRADLIVVGSEAERASVPYEDVVLSVLDGAHVPVLVLDAR